MIPASRWLLTGFLFFPPLFSQSTDEQTVRSDLAGLFDRFNPAECRMKPSWTSLSIPDSGFIELNEDGTTALHEDIPETGWVRGTGRESDLLVHADGPSGSGRYWRITVGFAAKNRNAPTSGVCLSATTIGWRTLQSFKTPIRWVEDKDGDGDPELVLWESFSLEEDPTALEFGLMAWVYKSDTLGALALDIGLSRSMAGEIALAYRAPKDNTDSRLNALREKAAALLELFASGRCEISE